MTVQTVTVSVVSHGHGDMVARLCKALLLHAQIGKVVVTLNIPETLHLPQDARITCLRNTQPKGFGANHNAAFAHCATDYFVVLNPDIELVTPSPVLFASLIEAVQHPRTALTAPIVRAPDGTLEDNFRRFPTFIGLYRKWLFGERGSYGAEALSSAFSPDWIAGMFLLFKRDAFVAIGGFDERFFLYYEDVDICARLRQAGWDLKVAPGSDVIHHAQRDSWHKARFRKLHAASLARYFRHHPRFLFCR